MRRWAVLVLLVGAFLFPLGARAQADIKLNSLQVQLWPEYDQPSVLVIYDFKVPDATQLPVSVSIRFPKDANLVAVASQTTDGRLLNADYVGPEVGDPWQTVTVTVQSVAIYHLEYYQPFSKSGSVREFAFLWPGDHAVDDFGLTVRVPVDTTNITTTPILDATQAADGIPYLKKDFGPLAVGQQFSLQLNYTRTSDTLAAPQQDLQPSEPLGATTSGRVMLSNYFPYIIGVLGLVLIIGGSVYFWQSSRGGRSTGDGRRHRASQRTDQSASDIYCHQCGTRAMTGDRFCRVCGSKLRQPE
jgi:hypothetical protein